MKKSRTAGTAVFLIVALLFSVFFASPVCAVEEGALVNAAILKEGSGMKNIQVYTIRYSGAWALATLTYDDDNFGTRGGSALLKKSGSRWEFLQFSGKTPTTDLLKQNNVPASCSNDLLEAASISRTKPILGFLHGKYQGHSFESVEMSGDYALATWYGEDESGMTLLKQSGNSWKVLLSTGGVIDPGTMRQYSVPAQHTKPLMGIQ